MPRTETGSAQQWDRAYRAGWTPWDIGRPQPAIEALLDAGEIVAPVLDVGCGTGEHTLLFASRGLEAVGVDIAETAVELARVKAAERGLTATFVAADALTLDLGLFATVVDTGTYHVFGTQDEIDAYVAALHRSLIPGGPLFLLCFSDEQPGDVGPRRVRQEEIRRDFAAGWTVESIDRASFEALPPFGAARAWLARIRRGDDGQ